MEIPYDKDELRFAILGLGLSGTTKNKAGKEKIKKAADRQKDYVPDNKKDFNKKVAEYNGLSVKEFLDSPNYKVLCQEYFDSFTKKFANELTKELNITKKEAWAIIAYAFGLLD